MKNILELLDKTLGYDDERNTVIKSDIDSIIECLENNVNVLGFDPAKIYKSYKENIPPERYQDLSDPTVVTRYAEGRLFRWGLQWIWFFGTVSDTTHPNSKMFEQGIFDHRIEATIERCQQLCKNESFMKMLTLYTEKTDYTRSDYSDDINSAFYVTLMRNAYRKMHNTNIQTATQLMIYAVTTSSDTDSKKLKDDLEAEYGSRYYGLPMI